MSVWLVTYLPSVQIRHSTALISYRTRSLTDSPCSTCRPCCTPWYHFWLARHTCSTPGPVRWVRSRRQERRTSKEPLVFALLSRHLLAVQHTFIRLFSMHAPGLHVCTRMLSVLASHRCCSRCCLFNCWARWCCGCGLCCASSGVWLGGCCCSSSWARWCCCCGLCCAGLALLGGCCGCGLCCASCDVRLGCCCCCCCRRASFDWCDEVVI